MVERGEIKSNRVRRTCRGTRDALKKKRRKREREEEEGRGRKERKKPIKTRSTHKSRSGHVNGE